MSEFSDRLRWFLVDDAFNVAMVGTDKATREQLIERGDEMSKALGDAADEIDRLNAELDRARDRT